MSAESLGSRSLRDFLSERRSTRKFQDRDIDRNTLTSLLETAAYIPSGGNRHAHRFTVLTRGQTRTALMAELLRIYRGRSRLLNSAVLRFLARPVSDRVTREFLKDREYGPRIRSLIGRLTAGEDPIFYGAPAVVLIHSGVLIPTPKEDCVLAGFVLSLAAQEAGIGACFVTLGQSAINASAQCKRMLGLPPAEQVHAVVVLGYPVDAGPTRSHREVREIRYA